jgi:hypothetical protein
MPVCIKTLRIMIVRITRLSIMAQSIVMLRTMALSMETICVSLETTPHKV